MLEQGIKYDMDVVIQYSKDHFWTFAGKHPVVAYGIARRLRLEKESTLAAQACLHFTLQVMTSEHAELLDTMSGASVRALVDHHLQCCNAAALAIKSQWWASSYGWDHKMVQSSLRKRHSVPSCGEFLHVSAGNSKIRRPLPVPDWMIEHGRELYTYFKTSGKGWDYEKLAERAMMRSFMQNYSVGCADCRLAAVEDVPRITKALQGAIHVAHEEVNMSYSSLLE